MAKARTQIAQRYSGFTIEIDSFGYCATNGPVRLGYCTSLAELVRQIEAYWADGYEPPYDSPSLPAPWWEAR